ncbi:MAG: hypothetical protein V1492_02490 [Candidatus Micrarchaeota archaeon]
MKAREFWSEAVTTKSWEQLGLLSREYDFILIGGWAVYLWTGAHKSKDIDIVIDYDTLNVFRSKFPLEKNERLRKYEIKMGEFDVDIYLPGYSRLAVPVEQIKDYTANVQGMRVPVPELLVLLKQGAEIERRGSVKGKKDLIDLLTILVYSDFSVAKYKELAIKFSMKEQVKLLEEEILLFNMRDVDYLGMNLNEFAKWKRSFLAELKK